MLQAMLLVVTISLLASFLFCAILIRFAARLGLIDEPDPSRKVHRSPTPRAGGLGISLAYLLGLFFLRATSPEELAFDDLPAALILVVMGLLDDRFTLSWRVRLLVQTLCAIAAVLHFVPLDPFLGIAAVVWIVGLINAFNMLDNMDLLSGGTAFLVAGCLAVAGNHPEEYIILMGALLGFLWHNRPTARLFMGDAGSTFLGFLLAVGSLRLVLDSTPSHEWGWLAPLALLAVPWYDLVTVVVLRLRQGKSPFHADKQHLSHRLVCSGIRPVVAVTLIHMLALANGVGAMVLYRTTDPVIAGVALAGLALLWLGVALGDGGVTRRWFSPRRASVSLAPPDGQARRLPYE